VTESAISLAVGYRPSGTPDSILLLASSRLSGMIPASSTPIISVLTGPGQIALTRMPCAAPSIAAVFIMPMTACLLAT
jgi:hypothetical protein